MTFWGWASLGLSGALTTLTAACVFVGLWRLWRVRHAPDDDAARRMIMFAAAILLVFSTLWQNTVTWLSRHFGLWWVEAPPLWLTMTPLATSLVALIIFGGAALWVQCRHKGWITLSALSMTGAGASMLLCCWEWG